MPRNASTGAYTAPTSSVNPAVGGTAISSTDFNALRDDIATALSTADATTRALWARAGQVQDGAFLWGGTAGGTADARTITLTPPITAYAAGQRFVFRNGAAANATTTPTLAVNGLAATTITRSDGSVLTTGDMPANGVLDVIYDGTNFRLSSTPVPPVQIIRSARTSNTILANADRATFVDITSGTFSQTFTAAATLGSGWYVWLRNSGTGDITLDPNGSETIDGLTTFIMYPGEARLIQCDGTQFFSVILESGSRTFTASGTFVVPPGISGLAIESFGAGGGGGGGRRGAAASDRGGGGGGGGGGRSRAFFTTIAAGTSVSVTVGAGGTAGASATTDNTNGGAGGVGGNSSFGSYLIGYGGGGGAGADASSTATGGGGGGVLGAGVSGASGGNGGLPRPTQANLGAQGGNRDSIGGGGAGAAPNTAGVAGGNAEFGGGGGSQGANAATPGAGGSSVFGGGAGAGGGGIDTTDTARAGGTGGASNSYTAGGGGAGGAATGVAGTAGADGTLGYAGAGGGGGGARASGGAGGAGGAGGDPGGGGGGGGASLNGNNSGAGGAGGRGEVRVWWW